jgi:hypothetical protein
MIKTNAVEVSIHAVSPSFIVWAEAALTIERIANNVSWKFIAINTLINRQEIRPYLEV